MSKTTANDVADFLLYFAHDHGDTLTNLKLQKLAYYAQAWFLALNNEELFNDEFEAWVHGPVCVTLYHRFKRARWNPITENPEKPNLDEDICNHLQEVFSVFGKYSAFDLEQMTHSEDPWIHARGHLALDEASRSIIPKESMLQFYSAVAESEE